MSTINFLIHGTQDDKIASFCYSNNDTYPTSLKGIHSFEGKPNISDDGKTKTIDIDQSIRITTVSDKCLKESVEIWNKLKNRSLAACVLAGMCVVPLLIAAGAAGGLLGLSLFTGTIALILAPTMVVVAISIIAFTSAFPAFAYIAYRRYQTAKQEYNSFTNELKKADYHCEQRKKLRENSLEAIKNDASLAHYLSNDELTSNQELYSYCKETLQTLSDQAKSEETREEFQNSFFKNLFIVDKLLDLNTNNQELRKSMEIFKEARRWNFTLNEIFCFKFGNLCDEILKELP